LPVALQAGQGIRLREIGPIGGGPGRCVNAAATTIALLKRFAVGWPKWQRAIGDADAPQGETT